MNNKDTRFLEIELGLREKIIQRQQMLIDLQKLNLNVMREENRDECR